MCHRSVFSVVAKPFLTKLTKKSQRTQRKNHNGVRPIRVIHVICGQDLLVMRRHALQPHHRWHRRRIKLQKTRWYTGTTGTKTSLVQLVQDKNRLVRWYKPMCGTYHILDGVANV